MKRIYSRGKHLGGIREFEEYDEEGRRVQERKV